MKIGRNNDIVESYSDFGGGNTERECMRNSTRSYDEDRLLGNSYKILEGPLLTGRDS